MDDHIDIELLSKNFKRNNIPVLLIEDRNTLIDFLGKSIPPNSVVGVGDSVTLEETGVYDFLRNGTYQFLDKYRPHLSKDEKRQLYINNFSADFFLSGVNAVCMDGTIFNLDGNGSRVAPMIYGPGKVFLIAGLNKVVADADAAYERIRSIAAPLDNIRLGKPNPCVKTGTCMDCKSKTKICNYFTKIQGQFDGKRIHLLLLKGKYGY